MTHFEKLSFLAEVTFNKTSLNWKHYVCNACRDLFMMFINLNGISILNILDIDYCCIISGISKSEALNLLQNADLNEKSKT